MKHSYTIVTKSDKNSMSVPFTTYICVHALAPLEKNKSTCINPDL